MNCSRIPGMSASGDSVSTSVHAWSAAAVVPIWADAVRAASVGYTRRLDRSPHLAHSACATYGGPGTVSAVAFPARTRAAVMAAAGTAKMRRIDLPRLSLDVEDFGTDV